VLATGRKVAIKEMDLTHQPRKELIVNEILVMKESQHPNIVNFLDSYLVKTTDLWVVMEYMEGGALTDIIENNTLEEDQISCISLEVWFADMMHMLDAHVHFATDMQGSRPSPQSAYHSSRHQVR
jgi:serine/threonine protein kinase